MPALLMGILPIKSLVFTTSGAPLPQPPIETNTLEPGIHSKVSAAYDPGD
ncbi:MAG: hypothetical protein K8R06_03755 [Methanosarcinales archaeon]|nr:hypothetical protein [Methanosarcinales archaeon]